VNFGLPENHWHMPLLYFRTLDYVTVKAKLSLQTCAVRAFLLKRWLGEFSKCLISMERGACAPMANASLKRER
ncbi:MAG: hypothetical protein V3U82_09265, partial [Robiginitomaculum sp.]